MGVDCTAYLMFGTKIDVDKFDYDKHQLEIEGAPDRKFDIVYDEICGEYCIAGKIMAFVDNDDDEHKMVDQDIDLEALALVMSDSFGYSINPDDLSLILFNHFH